VDLRLTPADPAVVRRLMATAYLASPSITTTQGKVQLAPHQVDAASRLMALLAQYGGAVLADATGLGKTFVATAVARLHQPALIVAPAALRGMWHESLGRTGVSATVASYEALSRGHRLDQRPALLVLDEAHHARNRATRRYAALADLAWGARVLLLTATPVHNRRRDLRALIALFLGSRADQMTDDELLHIIVRRNAGAIAGQLPATSRPRWLNVPSDPETLRAITALPPAVTVAGGTAVHALLVLGLIRAWSSSEAALRETLRRRLRRAASLEAALESGRLPDRRELASWPVIDDAIQLGFPELLIRKSEQAVDIERIRSVLHEHVEGVRAIVRCLDRNGGAADHERAGALGSLQQRHETVPIVAFSQFADTAMATFRGCAHGGGAALVTGRGARIASGPVTVDEIVSAFDSGHGRATPAAMPLSLLIATDVLSEGLSLRRAGVLVHLDLPWTMARLEQRVGRLRRLGSGHRTIAVYAIGPPVSARELMPVLRALQRKARVATAIVGDSELQSSLPLLGRRLGVATSALGRVDAHEKLRATLRRWLDADYVAPESVPRTSTTLALVASGGIHRLVAVDDSGATESPDAVLRVVGILGTRRSPVPASMDWRDIVAPIVRWIEEQRGRDLARLATDSPSPAHATLLRMLQQRLESAARTERTVLGPQVERCRQLVLVARGIGAERFISRLSEPELDLDAIEKLLRSRMPAESTVRSAPQLLAVLALRPDHAGVVSGYVQEVTGE
jgi:superfamily II DNA or RNA helicase